MDLIEVRSDERIDMGALNVWLRQQEGLPGGEPTIKQFGGGKANLTYLLSFPDGGELVLRRPPLGPLAASAHDMSREFTVLSRLWRVFDKAPRAVAFCGDTSVIGSEFFLMERRPGVVIRGVVPVEFGRGVDPAANRALSTVVIDTLAELHGADPAECGLGDFGHPEGFLRRQVEGWVQRWDKARHEDNPLADELGRWLAANLPTSAAPTILHNDWRLDNMAVTPDDPGVCTAVYDWDMATRGDPLADLGTLMASWFDPGEDPGELAMMPTTLPGWLSRKEAVERYGELTDADLTAIDWYLVFGAWKLGIVLQQIYIRWLKGQTRDPRFSMMDEGARRLFAISHERRP